MWSLAIGLVSLLSPQAQDSRPHSSWQVTQFDNGVVLHVGQEKAAHRLGRCRGSLGFLDVDKAERLRDVNWECAL